MLSYCEYCQVLFEGSRCPVCKNRRVRQPRQDDMCLLCEKDAIWAEMLMQALKNDGIPVSSKSVLGAGLAATVGLLTDRIKLFVPLSRLEDAKEVMEQMFSEENYIEQE